MSTNKIMIFAPHPDDELINAGAKIIESFDKGEKVYIIYTTIGSEHKDEYASLRKKAVRLVLKKANLIFLGYLEKQLLNPGKFNEAVKKTTKLIKKINPDEIYVPAYEGGHVDHDLTHMMVVRATGKMLYEYTTYNNYFTLSKAFWLAINFIKGRIGLPICEKKGFVPKKTPVIYVGTKESIKQKNEMISQYARIAQGKNIKTAYGQDMFREVENYDYSKPPHKRFPLKLRYETASKISFEKVRRIYNGNKSLGKN